MTLKQSVITEATTKRKENEYLKRYGRKKDNNRRTY